jgi:hypothetical protein
MNPCVSAGEERRVDEKNPRSLIGKSAWNSARIAQRPNKCPGDREQIVQVVWNPFTFLRAHRG